MVIFQKIVTRANPVVNKEHKLIIKDKTEIIIIIEEMIKIDFKERDHKKIRMEIIKIIITENIVKIKMAIMDNLDKEWIMIIRIIWTIEIIIKIIVMDIKIIMEITIETKEWITLIQICKWEIIKEIIIKIIMNITNITKDKKWIRMKTFRILKTMELMIINLNKTKE